MFTHDDYGDWAADNNRELTADQADELGYYDAATSAERAEFDRGLMMHAAMTNPYVAELIAAAREVIAMGGTAANLLRPKVTPLIAG